jgi:hypothetical protein
VDRLKKHLTPSTVISCIALFVALSGAAYAAGLAKNSVKTKNIANGAVTTAKIKNASVNAAKLVNGAVIGSKIANGAVGNAKLTEAAIRSNNLGGGVVTTAKIKDLAITEGKLGSNSVSKDKIGANAVETGKLAKEAVTAEKLAAGFYAQLVKNLSYETKDSLSNGNEDTKSVTATCPAGKEVTGGGARINGVKGNISVSESGPELNAEGKRTGWYVSAREFAPETEPWSITAFAVCAEL